MRIRISGHVAVGLLLVQTVFLLLLYTRNNVPTNTEEKPGKVHLLILSSWRSGSSFLGQVFSQHPDVFYLMEPAWHVWVSMFQSSAHVLHMAVRDLVRSVFMCDVSVFDAYMPPERNVSYLFRWSVSRALCSSPVCEQYVHNGITNETMCRTLCGKNSFNEIQHVCEMHSHIVLKEVRFFDLKVLYPLLVDPSLNLKIIHLVRDPRAVFRSRERSVKAMELDSSIILNNSGIKAEDGKYQVMQEICRSHVQIYETASFKAPDFLKDKYMLVRYEDVALDPIREIKEMYKFANLKWISKLENWIYNITHGGPRKKDQAFKTTSRNALNVSQAWRTSLSFAKVKKVQEVCKGAMNLLGYQFVDSEKEQLDLSSDVVLPRRRYQFSWTSSRKK